MTHPLADDSAIQNLPGQVGKALRNARFYHRHPTSLGLGSTGLGIQPELTPCEGGPFGTFTLNPIFDNLVDGDVANFPNAAEGNGSGLQLTNGLFSGFPYDVVTPGGGGVSAYGFSFGTTEIAPNVDLSGSMSQIDSVVFTLELSQQVDQDPDTGDSADGFVAFDLSGTPADITVTVDPAAGTATPFSGGTLWGVNPTLPPGRTAVFTVTLNDVSNLTLADIYAGTFDVLLEINGEFTLSALGCEIIYTASDIDAKFGLATVDCSPQVATVPDSEIVTSGWLCVEVNGNSTWQREVTVYLDGVAQTPTTIDSGVDCSEPAPALDYQYQSVELCVSGQVQLQILQSINGGAFTNFGAPIATGKLCGQGEYIGQICYEELPGYVTTVATTGFAPNSDEQGTTSDWTITYNGSGLDLNVGRLFATIRTPFGAASNYVARITNNVGEVFDSAPVGGITGVFQPIEFVFANPPTYGPGETLQLTFVGTGSVRIQTQTGVGGIISSTNAPVSRPMIQLDTLLPADPKRMAYGLREGGVLTYYDTETNQILVAGTYAVCPPVQESIDGQSSGPILTTPQALTILEGDLDANNDWRFADLPGGPISRVRSFTVLNTSQADMTVTTEKGTTTLIPGGIRTWGQAQGLLDVSDVVLNIPDEPVNLIWEE